MLKCSRYLGRAVAPWIRLEDSSFVCRMKGIQQRIGIERIQVINKGSHRPDEFATYKLTNCATYNNYYMYWLTFSLSLCCARQCPLWPFPLCFELVTGRNANSPDYIGIHIWTLWMYENRKENHSVLSALLPIPLIVFNGWFWFCGLLFLPVYSSSVFVHCYIDFGTAVKVFKWLHIVPFVSG